MLFAALSATMMVATIGCGGGAAAAGALIVGQHENGKTDKPLIPVPVEHPDRIVFVSNRDGYSLNRVMAMNPDGSNLSVVAEKPSVPANSDVDLSTFNFENPGISQDGLKVFFTSKWYSNYTEIVSVSIMNTQYKKLTLDRSVDGSTSNLENARASWDGTKIAFAGYVSKTVDIVAVPPESAHVLEASNNKPEEKSQFGVNKSGRYIISKDSTKTKGMIEKTGSSCPTTGYSTSMISFASSEGKTQTSSPVGKTYCVNLDDTNFIEVYIVAHYYNPTYSTDNIPGYITFTWTWVQQPTFVPLGDDGTEGGTVTIIGHPGANETGEGYLFTQRNSEFKKYDIYVADADGSNVEKIEYGTATDTNRFPCFSPKHPDKVYFMHGETDLAYLDYEKPAEANIYEYDLTTKTVSSTPLVADMAKIRNCAFSPGGNYFAYSRYNGSAQSYDIYLYDINSGVSTPLVATVGSDLNPVFSPDGSRIAFQSDLMDSSPDIFVIDTDGTDMKNLTRNYSISDYAPAWAP